MRKTAPGGGARSSGNPRNHDISPSDAPRVAAWSAAFRPYPLNEEGRGLKPTLRTKKGAVEQEAAPSPIKSKAGMAGTMGLNVD